jgi:hypothetical protein
MTFKEIHEKVVAKLKEDDEKRLEMGHFYTVDQIGELFGGGWKFESYVDPRWAEYPKNIQAEHKIYILPNGQHIEHTNSWHTMWRVYAGETL